MTFILDMFQSEQFRRMATQAYVGLIKFHDRGLMQDFVDYMKSVGLEHDASNNQLTFWSMSSRSPRRERIVVDMAGPQDQRLSRHAKITNYASHYISYYFTEVDVEALMREMDNEPDKLADARSLLKDRANAQDPALRSRPISTSIEQ